MIGDDVPADGPRRVNSVWLSIMLSRNFSSSISYDAQNAKLSNSCAAEGFVWNTESRFQSARCRVEFYVDNTDRLAAFAREEGLAGICGGVKVAAGLVPETFESNGHQIAMTPISVSIALDIDVYGKVEKLLHSCLANDEVASLSVEFTHRDFTEEFMGLEDVDLTVKRSYPIVGFKVSRPRRENKKVQVPHYRYDATTAAGLTFTADEATLTTDLCHSEFSILEIRLSGKVASQTLGVSADLVH